MYGDGLTAGTLDGWHSFITIRIGTIPSASLAALQDSMRALPSVVMPVGSEGSTTHLLVIAMKRDARLVDEKLRLAGWSQVELAGEARDLKTGAAENVSRKLAALADEQKKLGVEADACVRSQSASLCDAWVRIRVQELCDTIQSYYRKSARMVIFSGWLPAEKKKDLSQKISAVTQGRCCQEWHDAEYTGRDEERAPVQLRNPKAFAPFQMLVSNFGIPEYGTVDPTPFVMPIYLTMFGLMFADVGQGAILVVLALAGMYLYGKHPSKKSGVTFSFLVLWCGLSSMLFGALFGSYFGMNLVQPLWFDFHGIVSGRYQAGSMVRDIYDILAITIMFGIGVILLGLVFNWVNLIRKKSWFSLILDKGGFTGGFMYACGVYLAFVMAKNQYRLPDFNQFAGLFIVPVILIFVKEPLHYVLHEKSHADPRGSLISRLALKTPEFFFNGIIELLEIFSGYLSNTLSFMRVAGLGIAHVCLMVSFFTLADMAGGRGIGALAILVVGNILVIGLEGLSAGIQALRLNYYEFFTKFFHGTGKLYVPVSLNSHDA
jgi:V/A-type H+-transporting ATPase subunit I